MHDLKYLSELENLARKRVNSIRATFDKEEELLKLLEDVPFNNNEHLEDKIIVMLWRLRSHYEVWEKVLSESKKRSYIRRIK
ncbi:MULTISPECIES: hypothetical protein [unclassified Paenibacillus]|uniref:Uncharacterized protein n=1 Tax=Paenibacillus provencensis TaxID=441151 RepID=A0ABW3Q364_9BACL|nr:MULTISPECIES: hypothetical protein [unclassified Paenibacillus]MCM3130660.1 hypothetical protein [Paenibacillus sp. MER 78]SDX73325.1 hypothetical protein SAMN05518848_1132 [Paenibacillus sp. PDC88]